MTTETLTDALPTDIRGYHQRTKHAATRYALGPAFLDWTSQPSPWRRFDGAKLTLLPLRDSPTPFPGPASAPVAFDRDSLGLFLELAFGLSAWKSVEGSTWALRNNPSSGNLHPTEAWVLLNAFDGADVAALYHYAPQEHGLETRATFEATHVLHAGGFLLALSSVPWRESWKYGERAYRYCELDVGHAIGAVAQAAAVNGWRVQLLPAAGDDEIATLLGLDRADAFHKREEEHPDLVMWISTAGAAPPVVDIATLAELPRAYYGVANHLSEDHDAWPAVDRALRFCVKPRTLASAPPASRAAPVFAAPPIAEIVRRRRSAQRMDGAAILSKEGFRQMLLATLPDAEPLMPGIALTPRVNLIVFVHRVEGLEPGLYFLLRDDASAVRFRETTTKEFVWTPAPLEGLALFLLDAGSHEKAATHASCLQPIAGRSCFSVAMIAEFERALIEEGDHAYRSLHWEAGLIGQALYLWSTALGLSGTGIGCFFDDEVHELIGLPAGDMQFQDVYHFTVGGAVEDTRILTLPAYSEERRGQM